LFAPGASQKLRSNGRLTRKSYGRTSVKRKKLKEPLLFRLVRMLALLMRLLRGVSRSVGRLQKQ
jgi:hypothetical protein